MNNKDWNFSFWLYIVLYDLSLVQAIFLSIPLVQLSSRYLYGRRYHSNHQVMTDWLVAIMTMAMIGQLLQ